MPMNILKKALISLAIIVFAVNLGYGVVPRDLEKQFEKAKIEFNKGDYNDSQRLIRKNISLLDESNISDNSMRGKCFLLLGAIAEKFHKKKDAKRLYASAAALGIKDIEGISLSDFILYREIVLEEKVKLPKKNILKDIMKIFVTSDFEVETNFFFEVGVGKQIDNGLKIFEDHAFHNYQELSKWWEINRTSNLLYDFDTIKDIIYPTIKIGAHGEGNQRIYFKYTIYKKYYNFRIYSDNAPDVLSTKNTTTISCLSFGIEIPILMKFKNLLIGGELQQCSVRYKAEHYLPNLTEGVLYNITEDSAYCQFAVAPILAYRPIFSQHVFLNISLIYSMKLFSLCKNRPYVGKFGMNQEFYIITVMKDDNIEDENLKEYFKKLNIQKVDNFNVTSGLKIEAGIEIKF